ncbi:class I glutamine amidotransferase-like protein [Fusarium tricinctum]|uniref:Class I glutamine amidotransferase-like protein n=1 Tax=Fusarium tricinctum TaxID=61284 RepID=A0A8K0RR30_9HYPO|nr:class I glutamine amidotransferase-like protein [Fusarium tricinctum]
MTRTFRLAVLECDTPFPSVLESRGSYGEVFRHLLSEGLKDESLGSKTKDLNLELSKWDVVTAQEYPNPDDIDGILLTGSKHTSFADDPWILKLVDYVKKIHAIPDKPIVGICFGHQIIGRALGAKVAVSPGGWEICVDRINLNETGQKLLGVPSLGLHQMHRDAVLEVPEGVVSLGSSSRCEVQGLYSPGRILSFQAHPEFDDFIMEEIMQARYAQKIFSKEMYEEGISRARADHDGRLVAAKIWEFLLDRHTEEFC